MIKELFLVVDAHGAIVRTSDDRGSAVEYLSRLYATGEVRRVTATDVVFKLPLVIERQFPILYQGAEDFKYRDSPVAKALRSVPWGLLALYEGQALKNHGQTLEQLAARGGLGLEEAVAIIEGKSYREVRYMTRHEADTTLKLHLVSYEQTAAGRSVCGCVCSTCLALKSAHPTCPHHCSATRREAISRKPVSSLTVEVEERLRLESKLETLYWRFDALTHRDNYRLADGDLAEPMSEHDAFKRVARELLDSIERSNKDNL